MLKKSLNYFTILLLTGILLACGNKGDLYIPKIDCAKGTGEHCEKQVNK